VGEGLESAVCRRNHRCTGDDRRHLDDRGIAHGCEVRSRETRETRMRRQKLTGFVQVGFLRRRVRGRADKLFLGHGVFGMAVGCRQQQTVPRHQHRHRKQEWNSDQQLHGTMMNLGRVYVKPFGTIDLCVHCLRLSGAFESDRLDAGCAGEDLDSGPCIVNQNHILRQIDHQPGLLGI